MEYEHYLLQWERGGGTYGIYTTDSKIAKIIRRRQDTSEFDITFPFRFKGQIFWLFKTSFTTYQSARKAFNRLLAKHSYSQLTYNRLNDDYESKSYTNCTLEKGSEVAL